MDIKSSAFRRKWINLNIILIIAATAIVYANSLTNSFIWDDSAVIVDNDFIKSWKNFPRIFNRSYLTRISDIGDLGTRDIGSGEASYRPIVTISYFIDYHLWGLNPFGFHLHNLILHITNAILLYFLINLISKNKSLSLLASLLFALHPVNSEAVNVISFREDLLIFLFSLSSFILFINMGDYAGKKKTFLYCASVILFLLALFSKEMAATLPILFILYDYLIKRAPGKNIFNSLKSRYLGYIITLLFYCVIRFQIITNSDKPLVAYQMDNLYIKLLTMAGVFANYTQWLLLPINIHPTLPDDPSLISRSLLEPQTFTSIILILCLFTAALKLLRKKPLFSYAIFWFFITLLPVANIFLPVTNYMAGRYLYLPGAAFHFLLAGFLLKLPDFKFPCVTPAALYKARKNAIIILLIFYPMFTAIKNLTWRDNTVFWSEMVAWYPKNALAHSSLGNCFRKNGLLNNAISEYKTALILDPGYAMDYNNLGSCYNEKGMVYEALNEFTKALKLAPDLPVTYNAIGSILGDKGLYEKAAACFEHAIRLNSKYIQAYSNLGVTYARMEKWDEARKIWEKALGINPGNKEIQNNLRKLNKLITGPQKN